MRLVRADKKWTSCNFCSERRENMTYVDFKRDEGSGLVVTVCTKCLKDIIIGALTQSHISWDFIPANEDGDQTPANEDGKPAGWVSFVDRPSCGTCVFMDSNRGRVPSQEVIQYCGKYGPKFEVHEDDTCNEYEEI